MAKRSARRRIESCATTTGRCLAGRVVASGNDVNATAHWATAAGTYQCAQKPTKEVHRLSVARQRLDRNAT
jgi:hypothetical protein